METRATLLTEAIVENIKPKVIAKSLIECYRKVFHFGNAVWYFFECIFINFFVFLISLPSSVNGAIL